MKKTSQSIFNKTLLASSLVVCAAFAFFSSTSSRVQLARLELLSLETFIHTLPFGDSTLRFNVSKDKVKSIQNTSQEREKISDMLLSKVPVGNKIEKELVSWFLFSDKKSLAIKEAIVEKNASWEYLNLFTIDEDPRFKGVFNPIDLQSLYKKQKKVEKMQLISSYISDQWQVPTLEAQRITLSVYKSSYLYDIPADLLFAVIATESTFKTGQTSSANAKGLMQVIEKYHPKEKQIVSSSHASLTGIESSIEFGSLVLKKYITTHSSVARALQAYNGALNDSAQRYYKKVQKFQAIFKILDSSEKTGIKIKQLPSSAPGAIGRGNYSKLANNV